MKTLLSSDTNTQQKLLTALNTAANLLQTASKSEKEVFRTFKYQIQELGLRGGIALLDPQSNQLVFQSISQPGRNQFLKSISRKIGMNIEGYAVPLNKVDVYKQVIVSGDAVFVSDTTSILRQVMPVTENSILRRVMDTFGGDPAIYCPLIIGDSTIGLINVAGRDLTENDLSVMKAFANYISAALANTRLISELIDKEHIYKSFFNNLPIGIYRVSETGKILMANPEFLKQFGVSDFNQIAGKNLEGEYLSPLHDRDTILQELIEKGEIIGVETEWIRQNGEKVYFKENITGVYDADGKLMYFEGSLEDISEKKYTENTIRKQLDDMHLLNRIAAAGAKAANADELIEHITEIVSENLFPEHFGALIWDPEAQALRIHPSYRGMDAIYYSDVFYPGQGITGIVYEMGLPLRIGDVREVEAYIPSAETLLSELCVPIKAGDHVLGVLNAERSQLNGFSKEEEILLTTIADQVATALEKAKFIAAVESQALQLSLLNEATLTTSRILEPTELMELIAKQIIDLFHPNSFLITLYDEARQELEISISVENDEINQEMSGLRMPVSQGGLTALVLETGHILQIEDLETSPLLVGFKHSDVEMRGSWLGIPLISGNSVVGALIVQYYEKKVLEKSQTQFLESLASHAAIAITNGKLFNDVQHRFELSKHLASLGEALNQPQTLAEVLKKIGENALSLLELDIGAIYLRTENDGIECGWHQNISDTYLQSVTQRLAEVPGVELMNNPAPLLISDVSKLAETEFIRQLAEAEGLESIALWPMEYEEEAIGAIGCYAKTPHLWEEEEKFAMMTFARQAALSVQNALLLEAERNRRQEAEALYKTTAALTSTLDIDKVLDNILVELYRVVDYASASLQLIEGDSVRIMAVQGLQVEPEKIIGFEFNASNQLIQEMLATHKPLILEDAQNDNRFAFLFDLDYIHGWIGVPLIVGERMIGCLTIDSEHVGAFNENHAKKAQAFANQAAIAIESARLFSQTQRRLKLLQSIHTVDQAISSNLDLNVTLEVFLEQSINLLQVDGIRVFSFDSDAQIFELLAQRNLLAPGHLGDTLFYDHAIVQEAISRRDVIFSHDLKSHHSLTQSPLSGYIVTPLISRGLIRGVVELFQSAPFTPNEEWMSLLKTLATQAAIAIENENLLTSLKQSNDELISAYDRTLEGWAHALELRDRETVGHARRVTELTLKLAKRMGISGTELANIRRGTLLHDIGKMGLPDSILLKEGPLTKEEELVMKTHPQLAYDMLVPIPYLKPALDIPYYHHEKWDGSGYPNGIRGKDIPLSARIFAVVDVWDALVFDRPYRGAWTKEMARTYIIEQSGTHFDPDVVKVFLTLIEPQISKA
ncbi:GAF domain-containing protein [bacterium]|nr:GAF domain-containing protein [bacterium]MCB2179113.1 GAF domain-containing protein [bacterium]